MGGGTFATAIVFIFLAIMYQKAVKNMGYLAEPGQQQREVVCALALVVFGVVLGFAGVWIALTVN